MKLWIFLVFLFCYKTILFLPLNHRTPSHINSELLLSSLTMAFIDKIKMPMSLIASIRLALWNIPSQLARAQGIDVFTKLLISSNVQDNLIS